MKKIRTKKGLSSSSTLSSWRWRKLTIWLFLGIPVLILQIFVFSRYLHYDIDVDIAGRNIEQHIDGFLATAKIKQSEYQSNHNDFSSKTNYDQKNTKAQSNIQISTNENLQNSENGERKGDGIFNGYPIYKHHTSTNSTTSVAVYSQLHCVGETWHEPNFWKRRKVYQDVSWHYRSCLFEFFCYDPQIQDFVLYLENEKEKEENTDIKRQQLEKHDMSSLSLSSMPTIDHILDPNTTHKWDVSQTYYRNTTEVIPASTKWHGRIYEAYTRPTYGLSLGSINGKWTQAGIPRLEWFPEIRRQPIPFDTYNIYTLPSSVVMIPFHSFAAFNPGHMVWDDFLPIYTLMQIFDFIPGRDDDIGSSTDENNDHDVDLLMMRYVLSPDRETNDTRGLWAGCDWTEDRTVGCNKMLQKFAPLMMQNANSYEIKTQIHPNLTLYTEETENDENKPALICSKNGLAGIGALSDHGTEKGHGWQQADYETTYNHGRGGQMWRFRNFMLRNIGISHPENPLGPDVPLLVIFSQYSSEKSNRALSFQKQMEALRQALDLHSAELDLPQVLIEGHKFSSYDIHQQVEIVSKATVYVTVCGGGAVTATFLPRGASALIYYDAEGGIENNKVTRKPARLDFDYFNNMAYVRSHWLPLKYMSKPENIEVLTDLILHELKVNYEERKQQF